MCIFYTIVFVVVVVGWLLKMCVFSTGLLLLVGCLKMGLLLLFDVCFVYTLEYLSDRSSQTNSCCHIEIEGADQMFCLTQTQCTDTWPTTPSADSITPGAQQGSHWSTNFEVAGMTPLGKRSMA